MESSRRQRALFAQLFVRHDRALIRYIMTFIPRRDDAEEVLQRAATVLWEKFEEYDAGREFLPWALRVAYFEVLNFRKENARQRLIFDEDLLEALVNMRPSQESVLEAQREALHLCLGKLDSASQALLRERYCDSQPVSSLAENRGRPLKAIYRRLYKLRQRLAQCVEQQLQSRPA